MSKFGRFEFGKKEPSEVYLGDYMELEKSCVRILKGKPSLIDMGMAQLVAAICLDKGQSVRKLAKNYMS